MFNMSEHQFRLQAIIFHVEKGPFQEAFFQCVTHNFYTADWQEQLYAGLTSIFMFVIPLVILVYTYVLTFWTLHRKLKCIWRTFDGGRTSAEVARALP